MFENFPKQVRIRDMAPREGLQSEAKFVPTEQKLELIRSLIEAGFKGIQVTSFVNPKVVKQFSDAETMLSELEHPDDIFFWATVPNLKGLERALKTHINGISVPISITDGHNIVNMNRTTRKAIKDIKSVIQTARKENLNVNVSMSTIYGCPIEGPVSMQRVIDICDELHWMGANALSFGDTTGMANPYQVYKLLSRVVNEFPGLEIISHFHDVRGTGIANIIAAIGAGVTNHDCALGGAGGQPSTSRKLYAYGRLGNVCTEDLVCMLEEMGIRTNINIDKMIEAGQLFEKILGRKLHSHVVESGPVKALWGGGKEYLEHFINEYGYKDD
jgi:hydroxymethylglutaryl-CoA lyase